MIVVVGGIKGGSGKTTVATNLAVIRAAEGRDMILIDADDQETASDFTILRNERQPDAPATPASSSRARPSARRRSASARSTRTSSSTPAAGTPSANAPP